MIVPSPTYLPAYFFIATPVIIARFKIVILFFIQYFSVAIIKHSKKKQLIGKVFILTYESKCTESVIVVDAWYPRVETRFDGFFPRKFTKILALEDERKASLGSQHEKFQYVLPYELIHSWLSLFGFLLPTRSDL
ncbi:hypothetical protein STEG23_016897, partial [Scotinomys teguina]